MHVATQSGSRKPLVEATAHHANGNLLQAAQAYRQELEFNPSSHGALLGLSLIARQSGQPRPALRMAQAAVTSNPTSAIAWTHLGHILLFLQLPHADAAFRHALQLNPRDSAAYFGLGSIQTLAENYSAAILSFERALQIVPQSAESYFAVAFVYGRLGDHRTAIQHYSRAVTLQPRFSSAWVNLGVSLIADGRPQLAHMCYRQALSANPRLASAHINLGNLHRSQRQFVQTQRHYEAALALEPDNPQIHLAFCYIHLEQQSFKQAWNSLDFAQTLQVKDPETFNAKGILLLAQCARESAAQQHSQIKLAIHAFEQAESLGHKTAASNRGNALLRLGRCDEALLAHQSAVDRDPAHPGARYNLALTQLRLGDYASGWRNYEARWSFREVHPSPRRFAQPRWQGESLHDRSATSRRVLIYAEQGLGDTIQFIRYLPLIKERGVRIVLQVQPPLARLLRPLVESLDGELIFHGDALPPFAHHCPLMSLAAIFQTTLESIPANIPYLNADIAMAAQRDNALPRASTTYPRIGIAWAGNPNYRVDHERSTTLETLLPLLELPNIHWFSLQKDATSQINSLPSHIDLQDASSSDRDLADTAALIHNLDLVITTDTVIAHLAGALGKPLWLLLPWQSDWRWMQLRTDTPWYPTARLFRQSSLNNWTELIAPVTDSLAAFLSDPSSRSSL